MEILKFLVDSYYEFVANVLTSESEMFENYCDMVDIDWLDIWEERGFLENKIEKIEKADMLYDFIYDIDKIKEDLKNAKEFWYEEYSKNESLKIYKEIQKVFKDFLIEDYENEIKGA